jgi:HSP20 family molecular chaperone IbpA
MIALNSSIDKFFDSALSDFFPTLPTVPTNTGLSYTVKEAVEEHAFIIEVEVPGVDPFSVKVDARGRAIIIECPRGCAYLALGSRVDLENVKARIKWGMLTIEVPRRDTKSVSVEVQKDD